MLSEFDVDFDGPEFETEVTIAPPPAVIVVDPLPDGGSYDVSRLAMADLKDLADACREELKRQHYVNKKLVIGDIINRMHRALADGYLDRPEEIVEQLDKQKMAPAPPAANPPRYRDLVDPTRTWSGRGKRPDWLKTLINLYGEADALAKCLIVPRDALPFASSGDEPE